MILRVKLKDAVEFVVKEGYSNAQYTKILDAHPKRTVKEALCTATIR